MSRVAYREPLSRVGFRPVYPTDPFQAAHRGGLSGMGAMGDDSATMASLGFSSAQVAQILAAHSDGSLSDNGYLFLLQGGVPVGDLANFLAQDPGADSSGSAAASSSASAGVPAGATVTYQGPWVTTNTQNANGILAGVINNLASAGLKVLGTSLNAGLLANVSLLHLAEPGQQFGVTLQLQVTGSGFASANDVASIVDHQVYVASGVMPRGSSATVTAGGTTPGGTPATSLAAWFEQNASWIFLGVGAVVLLPSLIGGRR